MFCLIAFYSLCSSIGHAPNFTTLSDAIRMTMLDGAPNCCRTNFLDNRKMIFKILVLFSQDHKSDNFLTISEISAPRQPLLVRVIDTCAWEIPTIDGPDRGATIRFRLVGLEIRIHSVAEWCSSKCNDWWRSILALGLNDFNS